jgi:hypothetical protein
MVNGMILAYGGQWGVGAWMWLFVPLVVYAVVVIVLFAFGSNETPINNFFFGSISNSLERATGFPGWSMAGVLSGLWSLLVVVIGFYWDVAWHIDNGRDTQLFTVPHTMILVGLGGLVYTACLAVLFATLDGAPVGLRWGGLRIPWSSLVLLALGGGAVAAFPLDNLWHQAYGIDVTLWSPTHLQLVGGGSLGTIGILLMCAEAMPFARPTRLGRVIYVLTAGTVLVGMSTFQGEFDFGVPQFQTLYFPLLVAAAAGFALVLARVALGRWGALKVALLYLGLRGFLAYAVGGALHHTVPRFPLYLPAALLVEGAAWVVDERDRLRLALVSGALVGTVGVAAELVWARASGWFHGSMPASTALKAAVLAPLAAMAAAVVGAGLARALIKARDRIPVGALVLSGVVLIGVFAYPLPRRVGRVEAVIGYQTVGTQALVNVRLIPSDAAAHADAFNVTAWQGGGKVTASLQQVSPGQYQASRPVPIGGHWKATVNLYRGDQLMAAAVYLPPDLKRHAPLLVAVPGKQLPLVKNTKLLLREQHGGPGWVAAAAYTGVGILVVLWVALMASGAVRLGREQDHARSERPGTTEAAGPAEHEWAWGSWPTSRPPRVPVPALGNSDWRAGSPWNGAHRLENDWPPLPGGRTVT